VLLFGSEESSGKFSQLGEERGREGEAGPGNVSAIENLEGGGRGSQESARGPFQVWKTWEGGISLEASKGGGRVTSQT